MSQPDPKKPDLSIWKNLKYDIPAGIVVFLVAIPLCLGIALASKGEIDRAPLFSGLLAGVLGGLVVPLISRSPLSVSGPAASLIAIVIAGIDEAGSFDAFLVAVFIGGLIQIALGLFKAGAIAYFFPSSVIRGMLAAIGLILVRKQLPHAFGLDTEAVDLNFHILDTIPVLRDIVVEGHFEIGAIIISIISLGILILWDNTSLKNVHILSSALVVVILGVLTNYLYSIIQPEWVLFGGENGHLVQLPERIVNDGINGFVAEFRFPDFSILGNVKIYTTGLTIGIVASLATLLSVEAIDKLDPHKRSSPLNRELLAQGTANALAGLLGALPITAVIVRSSANLNSGGQTRASAFIHGILLFGSVVTIAGVLNMIPLASLATILILIGYKLARPSLWKQMYRDGMNQFLPFVITIVAVLIFDLLTGITIGTAVGLLFIMKANYHTAISVSEEDGVHTVTFEKDVGFINKAALKEALYGLPADARVILDGSKAEFIDHDIQEIIKEFSVRAEENGIDLEIINVSPEDAQVPGKVARTQ